MTTYYPSISNGPTDDTSRIILGANLQREDLGRVQPPHDKPSGPEDGSEEKYERPGSPTRPSFVSKGCAIGDTREATSNKNADTNPFLHDLQLDERKWTHRLHN